MPDPQHRKEEKKPFLVVSCIFIKVVQCTMCITIHVKDVKDT